MLKAMSHCVVLLVVAALLQPAPLAQDVEDTTQIHPPKGSLRCGSLYLIQEEGLSAVGEHEVRLERGQALGFVGTAVSDEAEMPAMRDSFGKLAGLARLEVANLSLANWLDDHAIRRLPEFKQLRSLIISDAADIETQQWATAVENVAPHTLVLQGPKFFEDAQVARFLAITKLRYIALGAHSACLSSTECLSRLPSMEGVRFELGVMTDAALLGLDALLRKVPGKLNLSVVVTEPYLLPVLKQLELAPRCSSLSVHVMGDTVAGEVAPHAWQRLTNIVDRSPDLARLEVEALRSVPLQFARSVVNHAALVHLKLKDCALGIDVAKVLASDSGLASLSLQVDIFSNLEAVKEIAVGKRLQVLMIQGGGLTDAQTASLFLAVAKSKSIKKLVLDRIFCLEDHLKLLQSLPDEASVFVVQCVGIMDKRDLPGRSGDRGPFFHYRERSLSQLWS